MINSLSAFAMLLALIGMAFSIVLGSYAAAIGLAACCYYASTFIND